MPADRTQRLVAVPDEATPGAARARPRGHGGAGAAARGPHHDGPRFLQLSVRLGLLVGLVSTVGVAAGLVGAIFAPPRT